MAKKTKYNPEKRAWRGRSYKNGGRRVKDLRDAGKASTALADAKHSG